MDNIREHLEVFKNEDHEISDNALSKIYSVIYDATRKLFEDESVYAVPELIDPLIDYFNDPTRNQRGTVVTLLGFLKVNKAVDSLIAFLTEEIAPEDKYKFEGLQKSAIMALGRIGDKRGGKIIRKFLKDRRKDVLIDAITALGMIEDFDAVELIHKRLTDKRDGVAIRAAWALGEIGDERSIEPLIKSYKSQTDNFSSYGNYYSTIISALGQISDPKAVEFLIECLKDESASIRSEAIAALAQIKDMRASNPIIEYLNDKDEDVRRSAVIALVQMGDGHALEPLIKCLEDPDSGLKYELIKAIEGLGRNSLEILTKYLDDKNPNVRAGIIEVIGTLSEKKMSKRLISYLRDSNSKVRAKTAEALGSLTYIKAVEPLIECLTDTDSIVRYHAVDSLGKLGDKRAVEPLLIQLNDEDFDVRQVTADVLGDLGDLRAVDPLIDTLQYDDSVLKDIEDDEGVSWYAISSLEKLGDKRVIPVLIKHLTNNEYKDEIRNKAAEALGNLDSLESVGALISCLTDKNIQKAAIKALINLRSIIEAFLKRFYSEL